MTTTSQPLTYNDDFVTTTVFFGEVTKHILSKNFKGGNVTNVFGKTMLDFSQADINGSVVIYITQFCGEVIIHVPEDWRVVTNILNIFAVADDKRRTTPNMDNGKVLVLKGTGVFANLVTIPR